MAPGKEEFELLDKLLRSMLHGELKKYPKLVALFKENKLIFLGDEEQPVVKFIPEARKILEIFNKEFNQWLEEEI